jgi:aldose 1-epimerase
MQAIDIANGTLKARVLDYGATLADLRLEGWPHPLVLGLADLEAYRDADHYAGAIIGRFANRIAGGRARVAGRDLALPLAAEGNHLHGGATGFARQCWTVADRTADAVTLTLVSPDGHEGYPGTLAVELRYALAGAALRIEMAATTDTPTLCNLCHHPYFDLSGEGDVAGHGLRIAADAMLPARDNLVPTGEIRPVAGTQYDFRAARPIGTARPEPGYNNTYCLAFQASVEPRFAARLAYPGRPALEVWTNQPGLHLYDGYKLRDGLAGLDGRRYGPGAGLCLEAQNWPDSPNHPHFPQALLMPGETYRHVTEYRLSA